MNDKDKLISFINKGKEDNPIKEVHVIKDSETENHILLVNEDGTSIASNKWEVASGEKPLLDMLQYYSVDTQTISQEGMDLLKQKINNNEIVGISFGAEGTCMLLSDINKEGLSFIGPYQEGFGRFKATFNNNLSVKTELINDGNVESTEFVCADYGFSMHGISIGKPGQGVDSGRGITTNNTDVINKATQFINLFSNKESFSKHKCSISIEIDSLGLYTEVSNLYPVKQGDAMQIYSTIFLFGNAYAEIYVSDNDFNLDFIFIEPTEDKLTQLQQIMTALASSGKITFNILEL